MDGKASLGPGLGAEVSAKEGYTLAHADEAVPARGGVGLPGAVVSHLDEQLSVAKADVDVRAGGAGVPEHVRQRLLDDAVGVA